MKITEEDLNTLAHTGSLFLRVAHDEGGITLERVPQEQFYYQPLTPVEQLLKEMDENIDKITELAIEQLEDLQKSYDVGFYGFWEGKPIGKHVYEELIRQGEIILPGLSGRTVLGGIGQTQDQALAAQMQNDAMGKYYASLGAAGARSISSRVSQRFADFVQSIL